MTKKVYLGTRDLFFRAKLTAVVTAAGAEVTRDETACDLAVIELGRETPAAARALIERGVPVLAFGSHLSPELLREARELGAQAVPNSAVEARLRVLLAERA